MLKREDQILAGSEYRTRLESMLSDLEELSIDSKWSYFKWQWLRRNKFYRGSKYYEGIYPKFNRVYDLIAAKHKTDSEKKVKLQKELKREFSSTCGLSLPIDPSNNNWKECCWTPIHLDLLIQDIEESGKFKGKALKTKINSVTTILEKDFRNRGYQFPRAVEIYFSQKTREKDDKGNNVSFRSTLSIGSYREISKPRMRANEFAEGLIIWDMKKSPQTKNWTYKQVASALGIRVAEEYGRTGTANTKLQHLRERFDTTVQQIHQSINPNFLGRWK